MKNVCAFDIKADMSGVKFTVTKNFIPQKGDDDLKNIKIDMFCDDDNEDDLENRLANGC